MSYNIATSQPQFSPSTTPPFVQDWSFDVPDIVSLYYFPGGAYPAPATINVQVKDFPTIDSQQPVGDQYDSIILKTLILSSSGTWYSLANNVDPAGSDLATSLNYELTFTFQNLELALPSNPDNSLGATIYFRAYGVKNGVETLLEEKTRLLKLFYIIGNSINIVPDHHTFVHVLGNALPAPKDFDIYSTGDFLLFVHQLFNLQGVGLTTPQVFGEYNVYNFSNPDGITSLSVQPTSSIEDTLDTLIALDNPPAVSAALVENGAILQEAGLSLSYFTSSDGLTHITPTVLSFFMIIGLEEDISQQVEILSPYVSTITAPTWLTLSDTGFTGPGTLTVAPSDIQNFSAGQYTGEIIITANGIDFHVYVYLEVVENISLGLNQDGLNFTDNNTAYTQIFSPDNSRQVQLNVSFTDIGYPVSLAPVKSFSYLNGFFNNRSKLHLGEIVRRSVYKFQKQDGESLLPADLNYAFDYYNPVSLDLSIAMLVGNTLQNLEENYEGIRFVLGREPVIVGKTAFLNAKQIKQRVFKGSAVLVNFVTDISLIFSIFKNNSVWFTSTQVLSGLKVRGFYLNFTNTNIGDTVLIKPQPLILDPNQSFQALDLSAIEQEFVVFPDGKHLHKLAFVDEYGCIRYYDLSGDYTINSSYEQVQSSRYNNLVEFFKNEAVDKVQNISINSGFVPKDNEYFIDLICRARVAWLLNNDTEPYVELVPQTKELVNADTDKELYAFELTFKINRTHDFQNYS